MKNNLVAVFTGKNLANGMTADRGSGHWAARRERVMEAEYLLCVRNRRESWAEADHEHGTAFLVAKISSVSSSEYAGRIIINFEQYAEIQIADAWHLCTGGQRYPVAYLDAAKVQQDLNLNFKSLEWKRFEICTAQAESAEQSKFTATVPQQTLGPIQQAKAMLANTLNISEESIEIIIKF